MKARPYTESDADAWDDLVGRSACGTFLHTRRFLAYHGNRFEDLSVCCEDENGRMMGVLPAARSPDDTTCVASHPGATYGGLVHERGLAAGGIEEMIAGIAAHYLARGLQWLEYKSVPPHLHSPYSQADAHAIWKRGGEAVRRDLWSVVHLADGAVYSSHHQRELARARKRNIVCGAAQSDAEYRDFHDLLAKNLAERHGTRPVHTPDEMLRLRDRFPAEIALWLARDDRGQALAGSWIFCLPGKAWHTQYIATSPEGRSHGAGYLVIDGIIRQAANGRVPFLSFGSSTEDNGRVLNSGLFDFKSGFGAGTVCHDIYRLRLTPQG